MGAAESLGCLERLAAMMRPAGGQPAHLPWSICPRARRCERVIAYGRVAPATVAPSPTAEPKEAELTVGPRLWSWAALMHRAFAVEPGPTRVGASAPSVHGSPRL